MTLPLFYLAALEAVVLILLAINFPGYTLAAVLIVAAVVAWPFVQEAREYREEHGL